MGRPTSEGSNDDAKLSYLNPRTKNSRFKKLRLFSKLRRLVGGAPRATDETFSTVGSEAIFFDDGVLPWTERRGLVGGVAPVEGLQSQEQVELCVLNKEASSRDTGNEQLSKLSHHRDNTVSIHGSPDASQDYHLVTSAFLNRISPAAAEVIIRRVHGSEAIHDKKWSQLLASTVQNCPTQNKEVDRSIGEPCRLLPSESRMESQIDVKPVERETTGMLDKPKIGTPTVDTAASAKSPNQSRYMTEIISSRMIPRNNDPPLASPCSLNEGHVNGDALTSNFRSSELMQVIQDFRTSDTLSISSTSQKGIMNQTIPPPRLRARSEPFANKPPIQPGRKGKKKCNKKPFTQTAVLRIGGITASKSVVERTRSSGSLPTLGDFSSLAPGLMDRINEASPVHARTSFHPHQSVGGFTAFWQHVTCSCDSTRENGDTHYQVEMIPSKHRVLPSGIASDDSRFSNSIASDGSHISVPEIIETFSAVDFSENKDSRVKHPSPVVPRNLVPPRTKPTLVPSISVTRDKYNSTLETRQGRAPPSFRSRTERISNTRSMGRTKSIPIVLRSWSVSSSDDSITEESSFW